MSVKEKVKCPLCGGVMGLRMDHEMSGWFCQNNMRHIMTLPEYSDLYFGMREEGPNPEKLPSVIEGMKKRVEKV